MSLLGCGCFLVILAILSFSTDCPILHFCVWLYSNVESKASRIKAFSLKSYFFTMAMDREGICKLYYTKGKYKKSPTGLRNISRPTKDSSDVNSYFTYV